MTGQPGHKASRSSREVSGPPGRPAGAGWREGLLVLGILLALGVLRFGPEVLGLRAFVAEDFPVLNLPVRAWLGESLRQGIVPFWTRWLQGGYPLLAESQAGVFSPLRLLHALPVAPWTVLAWTIVGHLAWAGTGLYLYLRQERVRPAAAGLAALALAGSATLLARHQHTNVLEAVSWWPWLLWLVGRAVRGNGVGDWLGGGVAGGLMALGGHAQFVVYGATLAGLEGLRVALTRPGPPGGWRRGVLGAALAVVVAGGLAAPQLLPLLELRGHSLRAAGAWEVGDQVLKPQHLPLLVAPGFWGPVFDPAQPRPAQRWEVLAYLGLLPALLAGVAVTEICRRRATGAADREPTGDGRRGAIRFWALVGLVALLGAAGDRLGVARLLEALPGWSAFRAPARLVTVAALALAILAGHGAERLARREWRWSRRATGVCGLLGVAGVLALGMAPAVAGRLVPGTGASSRAAVALAGVFGGLSLAWLRWVAGRRPGRREWAAAGLLVGLDLLVTGLGLTPTVPAAAYQHRPPAPAGLVAVGPGRGADLFWYRPDTNLLCGTANLHTMSPLALARQVRLLEAGLAAGRLEAVWRLLGVAWLPARPEPPVADAWWGEPAPAGALRPLAPWPDLPPAPVRAVERWELVAPAEAIGRVVAAPHHAAQVPQVSATGAVDPRVRAGADAGVRAGADPAQNLTDAVPAGLVWATANRVAWRETGAVPAGWLVAQNPYPGWRASVDGEPRPLAVANVAQTLIVRGPGPAGVVRLVYDPLTLRCGLFVALVTLGVIGGVVIARRSDSHLPHP